MSVFEIKDAFYLDGEKFQVISGAIHYFRVVPEYWRDRLVKLRNMGCNTVETYIPWNYHEPRKGEFDFEGIKDVEKFIRTAQEVGLYVILRPSPYICAEWEFGGLPAWLLKDDGIRLRCYDERYIKHVMDYYDELIPRLAALQVTKGGPVIMMQVENEYGSYGDDKRYLAALRDGMRARGVDVPLITSDGPEHDMLMCGHVDGVFQSGNFGSDAIGRFKVLDEYGIEPKMCMEFWCGWFDHWGNGGHKTTDPAAAAKDLGDMLDLGNVNIYMFHGGTSFGLMNGANYYEALTPDVTSYDYDAPLSEEGRITEKYRLFKQEIEKRRGEIPQLPLEDIPAKAFGAASMVASGALIPAAKALECHKGVNPVSMERLGQDYGYTLYHTTLVNERELRKIQLTAANDRAVIYLDGEHILTLYDHDLENAYIFEEPVPVRAGASLDILVENLGRVNYSYKLEMQRKGIDGAVVINNHLHYGWEMYCIDESAMGKLNACGGCEGVSGVYDYEFDADAPADTFLELPGWGKGTVLLNGFTLGRFWEIGPQKRLYIPAPLLRQGKNALRIIETEGRCGEVLLKAEPDIG